MNINKLIHDIKPTIGLGKYLKTSFDDRAIHDIIINHALRIWNYYFKYDIDLGKVDFDLETVISNTELSLPKSIIETVKRSRLEIEDISRITWTSNLYRGTAYTNSMMAAYGSRMDQDTLFMGHRLMEEQGDLDLFFNDRYSCWFTKPNLLKFNYPVARGWNDESFFDGPMSLHQRSARLEVRVTQASNLIGITPGREPLFFKLARLCVMKVLFETEAKFVQNIQSGTGEIDIKVEEWAQAGEKLEELEKELANYGIFSQPTVVQF